VMNEREMRRVEMIRMVRWRKAVDARGMVVR
jgi:hypothetical protein